MFEALSSPISTGVKILGGLASSALIGVITYKVAKMDVSDALKDDKKDDKTTATAAAPVTAPVVAAPVTAPVVAPATPVITAGSPGVEATLAKMVAAYEAEAKLRADAEAARKAEEATRLAELAQTERDARLANAIALALQNQSRSNQATPSRAKSES